MSRLAGRRRGSRMGGFTLIELMVAMVVIAILAAIMVPNFLHARESAQLTACEQNLRALWTAKCVAEAEKKRAGLLNPGPGPNTGYGFYLIPGNQAYNTLRRYCPVEKFRCPLGGSRNGAYMYWELHQASYEKTYPGSVIYTSSFSCLNSQKHPGCARSASLGGFPRWTARGLSLTP